MAAIGDRHRGDLRLSSHLACDPALGRFRGTRAYYGSVVTLRRCLPWYRLWVLIRPDEARVVTSGSDPFALDEVPALLARMGARPRYG